MQEEEAVVVVVATAASASGLRLRSLQRLMRLRSTMMELLGI